MMRTWGIQHDGAHLPSLAERRKKVCTMQEANTHAFTPS
jgi:hypothetical protein